MTHPTSLWDPDEKPSAEPVPETPVEVARCIVDSLALAFCRAAPGLDPADAAWIFNRILAALAPSDVPLDPRRRP